VRKPQPNLTRWVAANRTRNVKMELCGGKVALTVRAPWRGQRNKKKPSHLQKNKSFLHKLIVSILKLGLRENGLSERKCTYLGNVVIASASRAQDREFEPCQIVFRHRNFVALICSMLILASVHICIWGIWKLLFFLRGSVVPFPAGFSYRQVAILLRLLGTTIIISPPYH
jgi:hypothetical protein